MNPFVSVVLQPAYGLRQIALTWNILPQYRHGRVYIYRSYTGMAPFDLIDDAGVPAVVGYFVDEISPAIEAKTLIATYRLLLEVPQTHGDPLEFETNALDSAAYLTRREHKIAQDILRTEMRHMRSGNGVPAFLFAPLRSGIPSPGFDFQTNQMLAHSKDTYGEAFVGGFGPPVSTWLHKISSGAVVFARNAEGGKTDVVAPSRARMLAFPRPQPGYMLVVVPADERYVVGDRIDNLMFKGVIPIGYEVDLNPIPRTDPRYEVPAPAFKLCSR